MEQLAIPESCYLPLSELAREEHEHASLIGARMRQLIDWLVETHRCDRGIVPHVERLCREFGRCEAEDRARGLIPLCTCDGWTLDDAEYVGIYDHGITDHHVIWDRAWAIRMLVPKELVPKVWRCGYGGRPKFWGRDGELLFQSVYCAGGHVLSREEREKYLREAGAP